MYVSEASKKRESGEASDHAVGIEVESHLVGTRRKCEGSGLVDDVGSRKYAMRLGEIGENYENLKAKVVSCTANETEQARGGQKEMYVPVEVDHVSGSEPEEDWGDVDEVRSGSMCYNGGTMEHFARY